MPPISSTVVDRTVSYLKDEDTKLDDATFMISIKTPSLLVDQVSRKHTYLKKEIDTLFNGVFYKRCAVLLNKLTAEDISNYKLRLIKKNDNTLENGGYISKENDTYIDKRTKDDNSSNDFKTSADGRTCKYVKTAKENTSIDDEPAKKKQKVDTNGINVFKLVLSRDCETKKCKSQLKPSSKPIEEIDSTEAVPIKIGCDESIKSENSSAKKVKPKIWVKDINKMMDSDQCIRWLEMINFVQKPNHLINDMKVVAADKLSISGPIVNGVQQALKVKKINREYLIKTEKLYKKYFCKSVNDTIVIIANIINIIEMSNQYHKERINKSSNKGTEAEIFKERYDARKLNKRHKTILETMLRKNFKDVVSSFEKSEFDLAFQMFFLSILSVHQVLKQPKFKKGTIFRSLVLLLNDSLENSEYPQIFSLIHSKTFQPNCIDLLTQFKDSRVIDPGVINRMPLLFKPTKKSLEYFQAVIKAVNTDSKEDLAILIDNAASQCSINSIFKDPIDSSTVTESNQIPANSDEIIQQWFLAKNPDGTYQKMAVVNIDNSETIGNTKEKTLIVANQSSTQSSSSPLKQKSYIVSSTSGVIPTKKCFVATSTDSHGSLMQVTAPLLETTTLMPTATTFSTSQPLMQNIKSVANSRLHRTEDSTNVLGVKHYQLVRVPTGQMVIKINGNNPQPESTVLDAVEPKTVSFIKCYARNCINSAKLLCSKCQAVQYCSNQCQEHDFYDCHQNICQQLSNMRRTRIHPH